MAHNLKYYGEFFGFYNDSTYRVEIHESDFGGTAENIDFGAGDDPIEDRIRGGREDIGKVIQSRQLEFSIHNPPGDWSKFDDLVESQYRDHLVIFKKDSSEFFRGWLQPENIKKNFINSPYSITLSVTDGLSDLKNEKFKETDADGNYVFYLDDYTPIINVLGNALKKTGFELDFEIMMNTFEINYMDYDSSVNHPNECALKEVNVDVKRFINFEEAKGEYKYEGEQEGIQRMQFHHLQDMPGDPEYVIPKEDVSGVDNCYTVIEKLLKPFHVILSQQDGKWMITNPNELNSQVFKFYGSYYSIPYKEYNNSPVSLDNVLTLDDSNFEPFGDLSKIPPKKEVYVDFMKRKIGERLPRVDSWDAAKDEWKLDPNDGGIILDSSDSFFHIKVTGAEKTATIVSDKFNLTSDTEKDKYIKLRLQHLLSRVDLNGSDTNPTGDEFIFYIGIICTDPNVGLASYGEILKETYSPKNNFFKYHSYSYYESGNENTFKVNKTGEYQIIIRIEFPLYSINYDYAEFKFRGRPDVRIETAGEPGAETSFDSRMSKDQSAPGIEDNSIAMSFGDADFSDDISTFKIYDDVTSNYVPTVNWNRWERDDEISVLYLYLYQQLNNFRDYTNFGRLGRYDKLDEIKPRNILKIPHKTDESAYYYRIIGWNKRYRTGYVKLDLLQIRPSYVYTDVGNPVTEYTLDSIDGVNQKIRFPSLKALDVEYVDDELASVVKSEASAGAANRSYTGQNVDNWNDYPELSGTDKRVGIRIDKENDRIIIGFLQADDTTNHFSYAAELEIFGAEATSVYTVDTNSDDPNYWIGSGDTITLDSSADLASMSGEVVSGNNNDCYTIDYMPDTTSNEVQFRFRITTFDDSNINTWNISCGDRLFGENLSIPVEFFFTPKDTEEIDTLRTKNAPAQAGADVTENNMEKVVVRQATAPSNPKEGWVWFDTDDKELYRYTSNSWERIAMRGAFLNANLQPTKLRDDTNNRDIDGGNIIDAESDDADRLPESTTRKWAGESGADITSGHTSNDTSNVNGVGSGSVAYHDTINSLLKDTSGTEIQADKINYAGTSTKIEALKPAEIGADQTSNQISAQSVTVLSDVSSAGSGSIITSTERGHILGATDYGNLTDANAQLAALHTDGTPTFSSLTVSNDTTISGSLFVTGEKVAVDTSITATDNLLLLNKGEAGAGITNGWGGLEFDRGSSNPYRLGFDESDDTVRVGIYYLTLTYASLSGTFSFNEEVVGQTSGASGYIVSDNGTDTMVIKGREGSFNAAGSEQIVGQSSSATANLSSKTTTDNTQAVATREDSPVDTALAFWNTANNKFETSSSLVWDGSDLSVNGKVGIGTTEPSGTLDVSHDGSSNDLVVDSTNGNVGIGTTSPNKLLTIQAASGNNADIKLIADAGEDSQDDWRITADGAGLKFQDHYGRYPLFLGYNAGVEVRVGTGAGYNFQVDNSDGDRLFTVQGKTGNVKIPKDNAKLYFGVGDDASIYYDGSDMVFDSQETGSGDFYFKNGNVGIGTDSPSTKLDLEYSTDNSADWWTNGAVAMTIKNTHASGDSVLKFESGTGRIVYGGGTAADELIFTSRQSADTAGEMVAIDNNGNVGIGTTGPGAKLEVLDGNGIFSRSGSNVGRIELDTSNAGSPQIGFSDTDGDQFWAIGADDSDVGYFKIAFNGSSIPTINSDTSALVTVKHDGNVGIGTTSPSNLLEVTDSGTTYGSLLKINQSAGSIYPSFMTFVQAQGNANIGIENSVGNRVVGTDGLPYALVLNRVSNYPLQLATNDQVRMTVSNNGNVGIGTASPNEALTVQGNKIELINESVTGENQIHFGDPDDVNAGRLIYAHSDDHFGIETNAQGEVFTIDNTGNVGIGTTEPGEALDVSGNEQLSGAMSNDFTNFVSGFTGSNWKMEDTGSNNWQLTVDDAYIRGALYANEFIINQILALNGSDILSPGRGKVSAISGSAPSETVTVEDPQGNSVASFVKYDIVLCQSVRPDDNQIVKRLVREVDSVSGNDVTFKSLSDGPTDAGSFAEGDVIVVIGSTSDTSRQSSIYRTTVDSNNPYTIIQDGVDSWRTWKSSGKTKMKYGNLNGSYGYSSDKYGLAAGSPSGDHVTIDPTNGVRFRDGSNNVAAQLSSNVFKIGDGTNYVSYNANTAAFDAAMDTFTLSTTGITIDSVNKYININSDTFGNKGIQLDYNGGNPRFYAGDGSNNYIEYSGGSVDISGKITAGSGDIGGWNITSNRLESDGDKVNLLSNEGTMYIYTGANTTDTVQYVYVGNIYKSGAWADEYGLAVKDINGDFLFELSDTDKQISGWNIDGNRLYKNNVELNSSIPEITLSKNDIKRWTVTEGNNIPSAITTNSKNDVTNQGSISVEMNINHYEIIYIDVKFHNNEGSQVHLFPTLEGWDNDSNSWKTIFYYDEIVIGANSDSSTYTMTAADLGRNINYTKVRVNTSATEDIDIILFDGEQYANQIITNDIGIHFVAGLVRFDKLPIRHYSSNPIESKTAFLEEDGNGNYYMKVQG